MGHVADMRSSTVIYLALFGLGACGSVLAPPAGLKSTEDPDAWQPFKLPNALCADGKSKGVVALRLRPRADTLLLYLPYGGLALDTPTTAALRRLKNTDTSGEKTLRRLATLSAGGLLAGKSENALFSTAHQAYLSYCSGDGFTGCGGHSGFQGQQLRHTGRQHFAEALTLTFELLRAQGQLSSLQRVVLAGSSAGALGVMANAAYLRAQLNALALDAPPKLTLIIDSMPPLSQTHVAPCLWERAAKLWAWQGCDGSAPSLMARFVEARASADRTLMRLDLQDRVMPWYLRRGRSHRGAVSNNCDRDPAGIDTDPIAPEAWPAGFAPEDYKHAVCDDAEKIVRTGDAQPLALYLSDGDETAFHNHLLLPGVWPQEGKAASESPLNSEAAKLRWLTTAINSERLVSVNSGATQSCSASRSHRAAPP